jgi:hypothetical protein
VFAGDADDYAFYISVARPLSGANLDLDALSTADKIRWNNGATVSASHGNVEIGLLKPKLGTVYFIRRSSQRGKSNGELSKVSYVCFSVFCSWVDSALISDRSNEDTISYAVDSTFVGVGKKLIDNKSLSVTPKIGMNIVEGSLATTTRFSDELGIATGRNIVLLPFIGANFDYRLNEKILLNFENLLSGLALRQSSALMNTASVEICFFCENIASLSIGYKIDYMKVKTQILDQETRFGISQESPYLKFRLLY